MLLRFEQELGLLKHRQLIDEKTRLLDDLITNGHFSDFAKVHLFSSLFWSLIFHHVRLDCGLVNQIVVILHVFIIIGRIILLNHLARERSSLGLTLIQKCRVEHRLVEGIDGLRFVRDVQGVVEILKVSRDLSSEIGTVFSFLQNQLVVVIDLLV